VTTERVPHKVIVLGWDGASYALAQRWADEGKLPNLAALRAAGTYGRLRSTIPPVSAPAWATFVTGTNPGRHGIYYFKEHVAGSYESRLVLGADRRGKPLWRLLNEQGLRMGAVNLVMTYPPDQVDGFIVSGMDAPGSESGFAYPPELRQDLLAHLGEYIIEIPLEEDARNRRYDRLWEKIERKLENSIAAVRYLLAEKEWDVFAVNFRTTDDVQHHFWKFMDPSHPQYDAAGAATYGGAILKVYRRLDDFVGEVRAALAPGSYLIVMSDHGFGPTGDKVLYLNNWLAEQGWLATRRPAPDASPAAGWRARLTTWLWQDLWSSLRRSAPQWAKDALEKLFPQLYGRIRYPAAHFFIDWSNTRAYADEYQESIWINLAGREPQGTVQPGTEYEELREEILRKLEGLRDPLSGEPVIERAARREDIYHGPELERAPDIVVMPREDPYVRVRPSHTSPTPAAVRTLSAEELRQEYLPNGVHRLYGMFYAQGPGIMAGREIDGIGIVDLAPTILHLAGARVPYGLDGRVIAELFPQAPGIEWYRDEDLDAAAASNGAYSDEEIEQVARTLRGLGYLD
jgi:predicted AlkP superfamily phosphohydrolase/phosphomutase